MKKAKIIKGNHLIKFLIDLPTGFTLHSGLEQIEDLALFDNFRWYYVDIKDKKVHIVEVEFADSPEELNSLLH